MKQEMESTCETLKFYSPLVIKQEPLDEYGEPTNGDYDPIDPYFDLLSCEDAIQKSLERENRFLDPDQGLMEYYDGPDSLPSVREKVQSLFFETWRYPVGRHKSGNLRAAYRGRNRQPARLRNWTNE